MCCWADYRGAGAEGQKRAVRVHAFFFSGLNNAIYRLINVKSINKVLIETNCLAVYPV